MIECAVTKDNHKHRVISYLMPNQIQIK